MSWMWSPAILTVNTCAFGDHRRVASQVFREERAGSSVACQSTFPSKVDGYAKTRSACVQRYSILRHVVILCSIQLLSFIIESGSI